MRAPVLDSEINQIFAIDHRMITSEPPHAQQRTTRASSSARISRGVSPTRTRTLYKKIPENRTYIIIYNFIFSIVDARVHVETARAIIKIIFVVYANVETMMMMIIMMMIIMMKIKKKKCAVCMRSMRCHAAQPSRALDRSPDDCALFAYKILVKCLCVCVYCVCLQIQTQRRDCKQNKINYNNHARECMCIVYMD